MNQSLFSKSALVASIGAVVLLNNAHASPYTKIGHWLGGGSTYSSPESTIGAPLHGQSSGSDSFAIVDASVGFVSLSAGATGAYAYAGGEARDTVTITGGTGTGTATFTSYLTGTFTATPSFSTNVTYQINYATAGGYDRFGFHGTLPSQTLTYTTSFVFGTPFDVGFALDAYLSQMDPGSSAEAHLTLQAGGYSVTGATSYTGSSSSGAAGGSLFETSAAYDGFTVANTMNRQSTVSLLDGSASTARNVSLSFLAPRTDLVAVSDIVDLKGTDTDLTVLQMSYDEAAAIAAFGSEALVLLSWFDLTAQTWKNAVDGNTGGAATAKIGAYDPLEDFALGTFGIDTAANTVWAVINHNSEFAVTAPVPEPGSAGLLVCGALGLLGRRRLRGGRSGR